MKTALITVGMTASIVFAQPKSAVQFYDTLGTNKTAKIGWTGDNTNGEFFVETPDGTLRLKNGDLTVPGSVTANSFSGETDPTITANEIKDGVSANEVAGLSDSLGRKADTSSVNSLQATVNSLSSSAGDITKITAGTGLEGGGEIGDVTISADIGTGTGQVAAGDHDHRADTLEWSGGSTGDVWKKTGTSTYGWGADQKGVESITAGTGISVSNGSSSNPTISANIGTNSGQVAAGNHKHSSLSASDGFPDDVLSIDSYGRTVSAYAHNFSIVLRDEGSLENSTVFSVKPRSTVSTSAPYFAQTIDRVSDDNVSDWDSYSFWSYDGTSFRNYLSFYHKSHLVKARTSLVVEGNVTATGSCCTSDKRFKQCVLPIDSACARLLKLDGVTYEWKTEEFSDRNFEKGKQIGLIAQDVEEVFPELVHTDDEGFKSIEYGKLTAVVVEAVKEQQSQIEELQKETSELRNELNEIKAFLGMPN